MRKAFEGKVFGSVQGVGFRYFTRETAEELGLTGWVRNMPDGTVEFRAEGSKDALEELIRRLKQGPVSGRVEKLNGDWFAATGSFLRFDIEP